MIDFAKRLKHKPLAYTETILNDKGLASEGCTPSFSKGIITFSGYWGYYLEDLQCVLNKHSGNPEKKFYLDLGRGYYLTIARIKHWVEHFNKIN